jgi:hypothetical protein
MTPTRRPRLFLDVDGVLNAFDFDPSRDIAGFADFDVHEIEFEPDSQFTDAFIVVLSPTMGARLAGLGADISWATTWEHRADSAIAERCGLPRGLPVLTRPCDATDHWAGWKFDAVRRSVESDSRPFVWLDDDIDRFVAGSLTARAWAAELSMPSLLIAPDPRSGLLPEHVDEIEEFLACCVDLASDRTR